MIFNAFTSSQEWTGVLKNELLFVHRLIYIDYYIASWTGGSQRSRRKSWRRNFFPRASLSIQFTCINARSIYETLKQICWNGFSPGRRSTDPTRQSLEKRWRRLLRAGLVHALQNCLLLKSDNNNINVKSLTKTSPIVLYYYYSILNKLVWELLFDL